MAFRVSEVANLANFNFYRQCLQHCVGFFWPFCRLFLDVGLLVKLGMPKRLVMTIQSAYHQGYRELLTYRSTQQFALDIDEKSSDKTVTALNLFKKTTLLSLCVYSSVLRQTILSEHNLSSLKNRNSI